MAKELLNEKINGKQYKATRVVEDGASVIIVEVDGEKWRYSPSYTADELRFALEQEMHNQQDYEAHNG